MTRNRLSKAATGMLGQSNKGHKRMPHFEIRRASRLRTFLSQNGLLKLMSTGVNCRME